MIIIGIPAIFLILFICLVLGGIIRGGEALESLSLGVIEHFEIIIIVYIFINMLLALGQWCEILEVYTYEKKKKPKAHIHIINCISLTISLCFYNSSIIAFLLLFFVPFFDNVNNLFDAIVLIIWCIIGGAIYFIAWGLGVKLWLYTNENCNDTWNHIFMSLLALFLSGIATYILHLGKINSVINAIKIYIN